MPTANILRAQIIGASLANRIPSALTPAPRTIREVSSTGIESVDRVLEGGLPIGALTEMIGPECSGRTTLALSFVAQITRSERVCACVDVSNTLHPESAAATGIDLSRLLWVRCGVSSHTFYLHLKETEFRFNHRNQYLYKILLNFLRKDPL